MLLGGADFGGGFWDLFAGGPISGRARRDLIAHTIGPVWEANHVWLILVITLSGLVTLDLGSNGSGRSFDGTWLLAAAGVAVVVVVVALSIPRVRRFLRDQTRDRLAEVRDSLRVFRQPSKVAMIVGGNLATQMLYAMVLGASALAFGHRLTLAELILTYTVVSLFAGFMPVPGGMGVAEAGYTAALVALDIPNPVAVSTAIAFRLVTYYLPPRVG